MADKKFGTRVKLRRQQLGLTQAQLAEKIGVRRRS
ncbi:MAG TPA: helix-turn-helix domain-containing protein [Firmicutes bacterium]|nr:helix-turn-helix domain-containing protein [Bacillota bacterium]